MSDKTVFEHPLTEKLRVMLRLEFLFKQGHAAMLENTIWSRKIALTTLNDLTETLGRSDIKGELTKDLERYLQIIHQLNQHPGVDQERQSEILSALYGQLGELQSSSTQQIQTLKNNEFLNTIRQRASLPGGPCPFDLPALHHWLQSPAEQQQHDLQHWYGILGAISNSLKLALQIIRDSDDPISQKAVNGNFHQALVKETQLLRLFLPESSNIFPEISGGKHRVSIRFVSYLSRNQRPVQPGRDVEFQLAYCAL